jgi:hypothetical protein
LSRRSPEWLVTAYERNDPALEKSIGVPEAPKGDEPSSSSTGPGPSVNEERGGTPAPLPRERPGKVNPFQQKLIDVARSVKSQGRSIQKVYRRTPLPLVLQDDITMRAPTTSDNSYQ